MNKTTSQIFLGLAMLKLALLAVAGLVVASVFGNV